MVFSGMFDQWKHRAYLQTKHFYSMADV